MRVDNALANFNTHWILRDGDISKRMMEHRSFLQWCFTHHFATGQRALAS